MSRMCWASAADVFGNPKLPTSALWAPTVPILSPRAGEKDGAPTSSSFEGGKTSSGERLMSRSLGRP